MLFPGREFNITGILQRPHHSTTGYGMELLNPIPDSISVTIRFLTKTIRLNSGFFAKNDFLLKPFAGQKDFKSLILFSQGYYTAESSTQGIIFNDLRFGQIMGWQNPDAHFVFHYYLQDADANVLVVQRGRFAGWDREKLKFFWRRIRGK